MEKVFLVHWPESQLCIACKHGAFVMSALEDDSDDLIGDSTYLCFADKCIHEEKKNKQLEF